MKVEENISLKEYNTFGVEARARYFVRVFSLDDIQAFLHEPFFKDRERYILGGGSNILFTQDFDGVIIKNEMKGVETLEESDNKVVVRAFSGENWNDFVSFATKHELWGIENLACIPGTVGAAPVQNIGAYGVETKDVIKKVGCIDLESGSLVEYTNAECQFGYRNSIFKNKLKGKMFVGYIDFILSRNSKPNLEYTGIRQALLGKGIQSPKPVDVSRVICKIRSEKLPDWKKLGTAGSFFKNPIVSKNKIKKLKEIFPDIPNFPDGNMIKVSAGWLIDQCGWKGKRTGCVGVYNKHALVLINHGNASGLEIKKLGQAIQKDVFHTFKIKLIPEVCIV